MALIDAVTGLVIQTHNNYLEHARSSRAVPVDTDEGQRSSAKHKHETETNVSHKALARTLCMQVVFLRSIERVMQTHKN